MRTLLAPSDVPLHRGSPAVEIAGRVLSIDGHVVESSVPFTVKGDGGR